VILDISMLVPNGLVAVRQILRYCPTTKIVILPVHDSDQTKQEVIAAGAHGFVSKGKDGHDPLLVVHDVLKRSIQALDGFLCGFRFSCFSGCGLDR
jgi:two-component system invasion response regulator UvrY